MTSGRFAKFSISIENFTIISSTEFKIPWKSNWRQNYFHHISLPTHIFPLLSTNRKTYFNPVIKVEQFSSQLSNIIELPANFTNQPSKFNCTFNQPTNLKVTLFVFRTGFDRVTQYPWAYCPSQCDAPAASTSSSPCFIISTKCLNTLTKVGNFHFTSLWKFFRCRSIVQHKSWTHWKTLSFTKRCGDF